MSPERVYEYWFGTADFKSPRYAAERMPLWFGKNPQVDQAIRAEFEAWMGAPEIEGWMKSAKGRLSAVILHDQFPRNAFRGTARMFAYDELALRYARTALHHEDDRLLAVEEAMFLLLPLEHSEKLEVQDESVTRFTELDGRAPANLKRFTAETLDYARRHRDIVARFGRFPHRNAALGRVSTPEETEFLKTPGSGF